MSTTLSLDDVSRVAERLAAAGCVAAGEEADELVVAAPDQATLERWVVRRCHGEPLAWIVGTTPFCGRRVRVDPGVYVPRAQSEELARRAAAALGSRGLAADLCTGAGAIARHLMAEVPEARVVATDVDPAAARCARSNGVRAVVAELGAPLPSGTFDVVTAVPPYVPTSELRVLPADVQRYEPAVALDGGADGLEVSCPVVACAARLLRHGGWLLLEAGGVQDRLLHDTLGSYGFDAPVHWCDEDGDLRGLMAQLH